MIATSADVLEFEALRKLLERYVASPLGRIGLAGIAPHTDRVRLVEDLEEAAEAAEYLRSAAQAAAGCPWRCHSSGLHVHSRSDGSGAQAAHRRRDA